MRTGQSKSRGRVIELCGPALRRVTDGTIEREARRSVIRNGGGTLVEGVVAPIARPRRSGEVARRRVALTAL